MTESKILFEFECVICMTTSDEPYILSTCGHSFCKNCLFCLSKPTITCPICRQECPNLNSIVKNYALIEIIKKNKAHSSEDLKKCNGCKNKTTEIESTIKCEKCDSLYCVSCINFFDNKDLWHCPLCSNSSSEQGKVFCTNCKNGVDKNKTILCPECKINLYCLTCVIDVTDKRLNNNNFDWCCNDCC